MIKVTAVGGYGEIGRNMTLITVDDESLVLDMGFHMERLLEIELDEEKPFYTTPALKKQNAIPIDDDIDRQSVKAIIPSHAHLDHIAAIPYLEKRYNCPIIAAPFTAKIIEKQFIDNKLKRRNPIIPIPLGKKHKISDTFTIELFPITHSIPQTAIIIIYTKYGNICYANDFKLDMHPTFGKKPDLTLLQKKVGKAKLLISECLYAAKEGTTQSESTTRMMLEDLFMNMKNEKNAMFVTTFSSHVERLQQIVKLSQKINRKVIFLGRSLEKYPYAAKQVGICDIYDQVEVVPYKNMVRRKLKKLAQADLSKYVIVLTGHQGEPNAILSSMLNGKLPNIFKKNDIFIFSCNIIPTDTIKAARKIIDSQLEARHVRVYKDIHCSGHAAREDLRTLIRTVDPSYVIPSHGELHMMDSYEVIAKQENKKLKRIVTGQSITIL